MGCIELWSIQPPSADSIGAVNIATFWLPVIRVDQHEIVTHRRVRFTRQSDHSVSRLLCIETKISVNSVEEMGWSSFHVVLARTDIFLDYLDAYKLFTTSFDSIPRVLDWGHWTFRQSTHVPRTVDAVRCWPHGVPITWSGLRILNDRLLVWQTDRVLSDGEQEPRGYSMELSMLDFNVPRLRYFVHKHVGYLTDCWPFRTGMASFVDGTVDVTSAAKFLSHQSSSSDSSNSPIKFECIEAHDATDLYRSTLRLLHNVQPVEDDGGPLRGADDALVSCVPRTTENPDPKHTLFSLVRPWSSALQPPGTHSFLSPRERHDTVQHVLLSESHLVFIRVSEECSRLVRLTLTSLYPNH